MSYVDWASHRQWNHRFIAGNHMSFDLNFHIYSLLQEEPFFAALSRSIDKRENRSIPTAGVGIDEHTGYFVMYYNPEYFEKLPINQRKGVLKHEFYHLIFEHVTSRLPAEGLTQYWNIATDLAINSHLVGELPEGMLYARRTRAV